MMKVNGEDGGGGKEKIGEIGEGKRKDSHKGQKEKEGEGSKRDGGRRKRR